MKRIMIALTALMTMAISANAMSFERAQSHALFLTDKMAYELNLTQEQYDAAYEINLDYLMGVTSVDDVYSTYWTRRNLDLSYVLLDWQWQAFCAASYFYRPIYWEYGCWHFGIYARYPRRTFFYFDRPSIYGSYRGGHSWRANGGQSFYHGRINDFRHNEGNHFGMRDRWDRGDFSNNRRGGRGSSTRVTVNNRRNNNRNGFGTQRNNGSFGTQRNNSSSMNSRNNGSFGTQRNNSSTMTNGRNGSDFGSARSGSFGSRRSGLSSSSRNNSSSFGTRRGGGSSTSADRSRSSYGTSRSRGSFGTQRSGGSSTSTNRSRGSLGSSNKSASFGTQRSSASRPSRSSASSSPSRSNGSFGSSHSGSSSHGSGKSFGGASSSRGGFGGHR